MSKKLLVSLIGALVSTNPPVAISNLVAQTTGVTLDLSSESDPVEMEYLNLLAADDAAQEEVDKWIRDANAFEAAGAPISRATLSARITQRLSAIERNYEEFLEKHPSHVRARIAYGSFLADIRKENEAEAQWIKSTEIDPSNPAAWNNLANHFGHVGPVKKSFEYYAKAMTLAPDEPVYIWNLATTTFLFRKDAREYYNITEEEVFDRALNLYRKAVALDPTNLVLATDYAQSYYGIKPLRTEPALKAWNHALKIADAEVEKQGIYLHLARVELNSGMFDEAQKHLDLVTDEKLQVVKERLIRNLKQKKAEQENNSSPPSDSSQGNEP